MSDASFALIGRTHPSDAFALLYQASEAARRARRLQAAPPRPDRGWRYAGAPILLPSRLAN